MTVSLPAWPGEESPRVFDVVICTHHHEVLGTPMAGYSIGKPPMPDLTPKRHDVDHEGQRCNRPESWCTYCDAETMRVALADAAP